MLILAGRVEHCADIAATLAADQIACQVLTGKMTAKQRAAGLDAFKASEVLACVATTLADEGLDVPDISGMIMAFPGRSEAKTIQRVGRTMRALAGKVQPIVVDLVDVNIGIFKNQWTARRRAYLAAGCEVK